MKTIEIFGENREKEVRKIIEGCRGIVILEGKILLSYYKKIDQYLIPGGGLESGESLAECCRRELGEETGLLVEPHTHYLTLEEYYHDLYFKSHYFICELTGECRQTLTKTEQQNGLVPVWLDFNEAVNIFGSYEKYKDDEIRYGAYYREWLALREIK